MYRTICISLVTLPIYLGNFQPSLASSGDVPIVNSHLSTQTALLGQEIDYKSNLPFWQIFARDDQTGDCLRHGKCRY